MPDEIRNAASGQGARAFPAPMMHGKFSLTNGHVFSDKSNYFPKAFFMNHERQDMLASFSRKTLAPVILRPRGKWLSDPKTAAHGVRLKQNSCANLTRWTSIFRLQIKSPAQNAGPYRLYKPSGIESRSVHINARIESHATNEKTPSNSAHYLIDIDA